MSNKAFPHQVIVKADNLANKVLYLAQSSLPKYQYDAFRKILLDYFGDFKRSLGKDLRGECESDGKGGGGMGG